MGLNPVNSVLTEDSHPGLSNSNGNMINCDKKKTKLNIDLNKVDNEHNMLDLNDAFSMPVDDEVLGAQNVVLLSDGDTEKNKLDLVSNNVGSVKVSSGFTENKHVKESEDANVETIVVTSGQKRRSKRLSKKERETTSNIEREVDVNAEADMDANVSKSKTERTQKERKLDSSVEENVGVSSGDDADIETVVGTSGPRIEFEKQRKMGKVTSTYNKKVVVNTETDIDTTVPKKRRGRSQKEREMESNPEEKLRVSAGDDADTETSVGTSGPKTWFGKMPKTKGKTMNTSNKKTDTNVDAGKEIIVPKRKRDRLITVKRVESTVKENVRVSRGVQKGGDVDNAGDEEAVVEMSASLSDREMGWKRNEDDDSAVSPHGEKREGKSKSEKYRRGRKRKMVASNKKSDINVDAGMEIIVPKRKRDRLVTEKRVDSTVEENVRVRGGVQKGSDVDNADDEEAVVDMSASLSEREMGGKRNEDDDSVLSPHGEKSEGKNKSKKDRRGRKRKMVESSVHELDKGACKRKPEPPFDGVNEVVRVLRSRSVPLSNDERKEKSGLSSNKVNEKMKEESTHLPARKEKKGTGLRGRPRKVLEKSDEKRKRYGLRGIGLKPLTQKIIEGCKSENTGEQQKETSYSDGKRENVGTKKQLLKERIKAMLIKAGWTIEFRPRRGKENYSDQVYVSPKGRGYWSVTLAYKILKEEVESGNASSMELEAYFPIAGDDWNSLLRITNKKLGLEKKPKKSKELKDRPSKVISRIKNLRKKHAKKKDRLKLKQKAALKKSNGKQRKNKKRLTLLARGSKKGSDSEGEDFSLYMGQRSLLSWMIDLGIVPLGGKVKCMNNRKTKVLREGKVTKDGIVCDCCTKVLAVADFDCHSGSSLGLPFQSICMDSKTSLLRCLRDSWSKYAESLTLGFNYVIVDGDDPNDDTCNMCGDGGNLICCDSCPSALHQKCLNIENFPSGDWSCVYCCCKFCGNVGESTVHEDQNCDKSVPALPTCRLCEEKYHPLCATGEGTSYEGPNSPEFCSQKCQEILNQLEVMLGVKHQLEEGFSWTLIQHSNDNLDISSLSGAKNVESNAKCAVAWSIMDECFLPIVDQRSGINVIRNVVYSCGSNIRRLNYTGFFIAVLERGDEIISVATIRIHGNLLAEMPFIGTRNAYRRQGMCRRLLSAIEMTLSSLNVEKLVLPAIPSMKHTWTSVFGFMPVEASLKKEMKCMNIIAFPGVDMLQKPVTKPLAGGKFGTADVANLDDLATLVPNAYSEPSDMTCKFVSCPDLVAIDGKYGKKYGISSDKKGKK